MAPNVKADFGEHPNGEEHTTILPLMEDESDNEAIAGKQGMI